jgi:hypothetical protein
LLACDACHNDSRSDEISINANPESEVHSTLMEANKPKKGLVAFWSILYMFRVGKLISFASLATVIVGVVTSLQHFTTI